MVPVLLAAVLTAPAPGRDLRVPAGFAVKLVAGPGLVNRPVAAALDDAGHLYVIDSSGSNDNPEKQNANPTHRVVRLTDADGDGTYDTATVYADRLGMMQGVMHLAGSIYVGAPPSIIKLTDTNNDGVADKREVWYDGRTLTYCANDLHGPYRGPDGYIYWTKGAFAEQTIPGVDGKPMRSRAAHIFRAKPDGTGREVVMAGGMDNPVDVVFTPGGERIFTTTFFQHPADGKRDGLVHAIYGGVYGKDHDPARTHIRTHPDYMPVLTHLGPAAPAGLHRYESDQFGPAYTNNLFACQFNLRKVSRHTLKPGGGTFTTIDEDFVTSDDRDFHPTDVIEDADGSLLVIDTGGWYKLCCPSSQLAKADVLGGIYRVSKIGSHTADDPRGKLVKWATAKDAMVHLDDPRPAVRRRATDAAAAGGAAIVKHFDAYPYWAGGVRDIGVLHAVEVLTRIPGAEARKVVRDRYFGFANGDVRLAAIHSAGLWRDKDAAPQLAKFVAAGTPAERRAAAEALGRCGVADSVPAILAAIADDANDRVTDHSLTYALIEIGDRAAVAKGFADANPRVRRAALIALEQLPGGPLPADPVLVLLADANAPLRETAWWVADRHPEWAAGVAAALQKQLQLTDIMPAAEQNTLTLRLANLAKSPAGVELLAAAAGSKSDATAALAFRGMAESKWKVMPEPWLAAIRQTLAAGSLDAAQAAARVVRNIGVTAKQYEAASPTIAGWAGRPPAVRLAYYAAAPEDAPPPADAVAFLLARLAAPADRGAAADALGRFKLSPADLAAVAKALPTLGPPEVAKLLPAFAKSADEAAGTALVSALKTPKVRAAVRAEQVKPVLAKYPPAVTAAAAELYTLLAADRADQGAKLAAIYTSLPAGDIRRGQLVFNSPKAACATCHQIGYVGGNLGPDLTRIGAIRTDRDMLESVVYPSASFVRSYEPTRIALHDGKVYDGIIKSESPAEITLVIAADKQLRIRREDIEDMKPGTVSVMPAGLDQQLSKQDLADLLAFLKNCK